MLLKSATLKLVFISLFLGSVIHAQQACLADLREVRKEVFLKLTIGSALEPIDSLSHKAAVVVFYKTDCPYCERLMPELSKLEKLFGDKGFKVFAICLDENRQVWQDYVKDKGYQAFLNYCDGKSYLGNLPTSYNVFATPTLFLVDSNWKLYGKPKGLEALQAQIKELLAL